MNKNHLITALNEINEANITGWNMISLRDKLPSYVAGPKWNGEIIDVAIQWQGYIYEDKDYLLDDLTDYVGELANGECEDYHLNINKRVQDLDLWAYPELDQAVSELAGSNINTLTGLNSLYLYVAMDNLYRAVIEYAFIRAVELESGLTNA
jgi:hypothetical protein